MGFAQASAHASTDQQSSLRADMRLCIVIVLLSGCKSPPPAPDQRPRAASAIARAVVWMAQFPEGQLRFDAAIGLSQIRARGFPVGGAWEHAKAIADQDPDNPLRRFFEEGYRAPPEATSRWRVPAAGERINVNRVVEEALYCRENGLRPEVVAYATSAMRDGGGYQTTHALWALTLARDRGCARDFSRLAEPLEDELHAAQPPAPKPAALEIDLFGERLLMRVLAGERGARIDAEEGALLAAQREDGGFGALAEGEDPYHQFHATLVAAWALAEWAAQPPR